MNLFEGLNPHEHNYISLNSDNIHLTSEYKASSYNIPKSTVTLINHVRICNFFHVYKNLHILVKQGVINFTVDKHFANFSLVEVGFDPQFLFGVGKGTVYTSIAVSLEMSIKLVKWEYLNLESAELGLIKFDGKLLRFPSKRILTI